MRKNTGLPFFAPAFFAAFLGDLGFVAFFGFAGSLKLNKITKKFNVCETQEKYLRFMKRIVGNIYLIPGASAFFAPFLAVAAIVSFICNMNESISLTNLHK